MDRKTYGLARGQSSWKNDFLRKSNQERPQWGRKGQYVPIYFVKHLRDTSPTASIAFGTIPDG